MLETTVPDRLELESWRVGSSRERGPSLEELILTLFEAEFAGVIRSHVRGEVYGGR